ncbi:hypothetical protein CPB85DRAFT_1432439 [Mucidula mucida]|nr:hypothetical protein CPB85DRAFT_1432439 [Mucidula mucida]
MATWVDFFSLFMTLGICGGALYGVIKLWESVTQGVASTKDKLKDRGYHISQGGVSVKTNKRVNREDYIDATQRGIVKAMNASSFGSANSSPTLSPTAPEMKRHSSSSSISSEKKSNFFGRIRRKD